MERTALVAAAVVVLATLAMVPMATLADSHGDDADAEREADGNASVAPGERLGGVVGVGAAELDGDVEERAFGLEVARASTNESAADVVADRLEAVETRLAELEEREADLAAARETGEVSEGKYRAEMATVAAETQHLERMANRSEQATEGLPAALLEERGVDADAIQTLRERAATLGGPQVAEIARSVAGSDVGAPMRPDHAGDRGPGQPGWPGADRPGAGTDRTPGKQGPGGDGVGGPPDNGTNAPEAGR